MRANPFHGNLDDSEPAIGAPTGTGRVTPEEMRAALGAEGEELEEKPAAQKAQTPGRIKRRRLRKFPDDWKTAIAHRVVDFARRDQMDRVSEMEMRLQRNAKLRQWTEGKSFPWPDASDVSNSDMMMDSLRQQDTLHNAVMQTRPTITVTSIDKSGEETQEAVENHLDVQLFEEQDGETFVGDLAEAFVNEGHATVFTPWIREERKVRTTRMFDPIPEDSTPRIYFTEILQREFPENEIFLDSEDFFDWKVVDPKDDKHPLSIRFYTNDTDQLVEMDTMAMKVVYDGPRSIVKYWKEVLCPQRAKNLQPPSPSNPGGAAHVILVDKVSVDELIKLKKSGFYDLLTDKDIEAFESSATGRTTDLEYMDQQDDAFEGKDSSNQHEEDPRHRMLTRYMCFDIHPLTEGGEPEDVIFWVIEETSTLCRAKYLTEQYPARKPRRPLNEGTFIPWMGRREGIGLPELVEGLFDMKKQILDQGIDAGTLANTPFFFYKPYSTLKPEVLTMAPGDGMPLQEPTKDVKLADFQGRGQEFMFNAVATFDRMREQLTMLGDIQRGAVPTGKSSALRTAGGINQLLQQGEARPERIIRRYMSVLRGVVEWMHELNATFLSDERKFLVGTATPGIPRQRVTRDMYTTQKQFSFKANILNSSRAARQESLEKQIQVFVQPLALSLGVIQPDGVYRLFRDWAKVHGSTDPGQYLSPPSPQADMIRINADDAFRQILEGIIPFGKAAEGAVRHLERLEELSQTPVENVVNGITKKTPAIEMLGSVEMQIFALYIKRVEQEARAELAAQARQEAAAGLQQQIGNKNLGGRPADGQAGDMSQGQVGQGQLMDKSLPSENR